MRTTDQSLLARLSSAFEAVFVAILQLLLMIVIAIAVVSLAFLLWTGVSERLTEIDSVPLLQHALQRAFSGVLLAILGLELLETLRGYRATHHIRLQVILSVALIAVGRHIMVLDLENASGPVLIGIAALVLGLGAGYFLVGAREPKPAAEER